MDLKIPLITTESIDQTISCLRAKSKLQKIINQLVMEELSWQKTILESAVLVGIVTSSPEKLLLIAHHSSAHVPLQNTE